MTSAATSSVDAAVLGGPCPQCGFTLVSERSATPWCPQCEWNLDVYEPGRRRRVFGWRWQDRWAFRLAYRMNARQFADLLGTTVDRPGRSLADVFVWLISAVLLVLIVAILALGAYLVIDDFPNFRMVFGAVLVGVAVALRPRFGKIDPHADQMSRAEAPALYRIVDEVATALGTAAPRTIAIDMRFNAYSTTYGPLRRRAVGIGLPLWAALDPQERVALLGHELGHFVNGDVRRGPITSVVFTTLGTLSELTRPDRGRRFGRSGMAIAEAVTKFVLRVLHEVFGWLQLSVTILALRSTQRAEYYADQAAARVAGTDAMVAVADVLINADTLGVTIKRAAHQRPAVADWPDFVAQAKADLRPRMATRRQLTTRDDASLLRSHPPSGLRARMIASRPRQTAQIVLTPAESARIDEELARQYRSLRHDMVNS